MKQFLSCLLRTSQMPKHNRSPTPLRSELISECFQLKRQRLAKITPFNPIKVATADAAALVDANPPYLLIQQNVKREMPDPGKGETVFYWMRMGDLRIHDNTALYLASERAQSEGIPLIGLFVISPQDYIAHDRSPRRIDFVLRNLKHLQDELHARHIPLYIITHSPRVSLPERVLEIIQHNGCKHLYANIEYELDELRRDLCVCKLAQEQNVRINLCHDKCIIEPGVIRTKQSKVYTVFSPWWRNWIATLNQHLALYTDEHPIPAPNLKSIWENKSLIHLFQTQVPSFLEGFELDEGDASNMTEYWPAGEATSTEILKRFLRTKARQSQLGAMHPLTAGARDGAKNNRVQMYHQSRDQMDKDNTSRLSVYLSSGVLSVRECIRQVMQLTNSKKVNSDPSTGIGRWVQELAWRDFYTEILVHFPRVSMGRPYQEKFSQIVWENHQSPQDSGDAFQRWKEGKTGVPIVDAAMRCMCQMGWVHNRARMIAAMYLTKDLMIDWRAGEQYFMQSLIDGDLSSNNGGWQWCASTGVDPCPYFRIFNPHTQSIKADPTGEFIRYWVPELSRARGDELHNPPPSVADKLGYPRILINHQDARNRALRRFKNPGQG